MGVKESAIRKKVLFGNDKALLTCMVQGENPDRIRTLMKKAAEQGAEAFGIQLERLESCYRSTKVYRSLFDCAANMPTYVTNYRSAGNEDKSDEQLAEELLMMADCGADLCDMMGDYFDKQPEEITYDKIAVEQQKVLINQLHERGAKVLMSSHVRKFISAEKVLKIALSHQKRGADISKIVVDAENTEQEIENLRIMNLLQQKLDIPFLFLSGGECKILRRIGGELGCCMYLCVCEYDKFATPLQPLLKKMKAIRDNMN